MLIKIQLVYNQVENGDTKNRLEIRYLSKLFERKASLRFAILANCIILYVYMSYAKELQQEKKN